MDLQPTHHDLIWRMEPSWRHQAETEYEPQARHESFNALLQRELAQQRYQQLQEHLLQQRQRRQQMRKQEQQNMLRELAHQARISELLDGHQEKQRELKAFQALQLDNQRSQRNQQLKTRQAQLRAARQREMEEYLEQRRLLEAAEQEEREHAQRLEQSREAMETAQKRVREYDSWAPLSVTPSSTVKQVSTWVEHQTEDQDELDYDALAKEVVSSVPVRERGERAEWRHRTGWGRKEDTGRRIVTREATLPYVRAR